jgi:transcriptional/translational regulatory protein YebC/TACO1
VEAQGPARERQRARRRVLQAGQVDHHRGQGRRRSGDQLQAADRGRGRQEGLACRATPSSAAIKKGAGLLDEQVTYDTLVFEGFGPHRVPVIVECLTENKNRTAPNMRVHFRKGQLGNTGSVSWDFLHLGMIEASGPAGADPESAAIECGAQDLEAADDATRFFTEPTDLDAVAKALTAAGWTVTSAVIGWKAKNPVVLDEAARAEVEAWLADLDADDDVQNIYVALA